MARVWIPILLAAFLAAPASAQALTMQADRPETGWIRLTIPDAAGVSGDVQIDERVGAGSRPIGDFAPAGGRIVVRHAAQWLCDRSHRDFLATAHYPDGSTQTATASLVTPGCANRFSLATRNLRGRIRITVTDRWRLGSVDAPVCVQRPGAKTRCRPMFLGGRPSARRDISTRKGGGVWRLAVAAAERYVYVRPSGRLRLLATGDSMIQIVDTYLKERLARYRIGVRSDAREGTGLSKSFLLNWPSHAKKQVRSRPDVTVVAIGANDGFPFGNVDCCGDKWVYAYAKRVRSMMSAYSRGGRGIVYWLTLPAPKPRQWQPIYPAVNRAIKRAAAGFGGRVRVIDIARTFTPGFRFRQYMVWHGHRENVRAPDGVHLSGIGASIAETLVERQLRKDGVL